MKNIFLFATILALATANFSSCSSTPDVTGPNGCATSDIAVAAAGLSTAATAYAADPSSANCIAYKTTAEDYLNLLDRCDSANEEEVQDIRDEIDAIEC